MKRNEAEQVAEALRKAVMSLVDGETREVVARSPSGAALVKPVADEKPSTGVFNAQDKERLYQEFKNRIIDDCRIDPILLQILTQGPEIVVNVEPRIIGLDGSSLKGRLGRLIGNGFFTSARTQSGTRSELRRIGADVNSGNLSVAMNDFVKDGFFTREGDGYILAPGVKVSEREVKTV